MADNSLIRKLLKSFTKSRDESTLDERAAEAQEGAEEVSKKLYKYAPGVMPDEEAMRVRKARFRALDKMLSEN